jgi:CheY-like chemotaxis protein
MKIVVCDDDPGVRAAVTLLAEEHGHRVIAETDNALDAAGLVRRFEADALILDLSLQFGRGQDALDRLVDMGERRCHVIVFSAFADDELAGYADVPVIKKPDFDALSDALDALANRATGADGERRRPLSTLVTPRPSSDFEDQPPDFFAALDKATTGDSLLALTIPPAAGGELDQEALDMLAGAVSRVIRVQDRLLRQPRWLVVLLVGGTATTPASVAVRVKRALEHPLNVHTSSAVLAETDAPAEVFLAVTRQLRLGGGQAAPTASLQA